MQLSSPLMDWCQWTEKNHINILIFLVLSWSHKELDSCSSSRFCFSQS